LAADSSAFLSAEAHERNLASQTGMAPETLAQLRTYGVTEKTELRLEYFFYTNAEQKAERLAAELASRGYQVSHRLAASEDGTHLISGWTQPLPMSDAAVVSWTAAMCNLGYRHDAEFDGWGTNPHQPPGWSPKP
jgi:regulator of RNase E activity RraB